MKLRVQRSFGSTPSKQHELLLAEGLYCWTVPTSLERLGTHQLLHPRPQAPSTRVGAGDASNRRRPATAAPETAKKWRHDCQI